jgi:hypothetical protein
VNWINACETFILFLQAELFAWGSMCFTVDFTLLKPQMRISHWFALDVGEHAHITTLEILAAFHQFHERRQKYFQLHLETGGKMIYRI